MIQRIFFSPFCGLFNCEDGDCLIFVRVISNHHFDIALWQMCCPGPSVPLQSQVWQKHCVLVAASNPHRLPTPVVRPPVTVRMQPSATGEPQAEQWWLADAETVAKAFPLVLLLLC